MLMTMPDTMPMLMAVFMPDCPYPMPLPRQLCPNRRWSNGRGAESYAHTQRHRVKHTHTHRHTHTQVTGTESYTYTHRHRLIHMQAQSH
jgi:hypothetical protein